MLGIIMGFICAFLDFVWCCVVVCRALELGCHEGGAQAAVIIVRKAQVGYPCVWKDKKKGSWPFPKGGDGIFMQCEAPNGERVICFTALEKDGKGATVGGETVQLDVSEFALFQPLFGVAA